jgi:hypothetical protein
MRHSFFLTTLILVSTLIVGQNVSSKWVRQIGGTNYDGGNSITLDVSNNLYVTGHFQGTVDFDPGIGVFNLSSLGYQDIFVLKLDSTGNFIWAKQFGASNGFHDGLSIEVDSLGNVYTTGYIGGTADFDPGVSTFFLSSVNDFHDNFIYYDVFISKLNSSGNFVWAKRFGGFSHDYGRSVSVDKYGNVYTTGEFSDINVDFDTGVGTYTMSAQSIDIFISKLDSAGNFIWAKQMVCKGVDGGTAITADNNGNVYSTGLFQDTCDFDPGVGVFNLIAQSDYDVFISKLDSSGNFIWAKKVGGGGQWTSNSGKAIAVDGSNNVHVTWYFRGSGDFDPGPGTYSLVTGSDMDIFILKLNSSGSFIWAKRMGGKFNEIAESIALDASKNVYTTGFFQDTCDFDPNISTYTLSTAGAWDIFVSKLDSVGNFIWAKKMGGTQIDEGTSIVVDPLQNIYTTGRFIGTADFDPNAGVFNLNAGPTTDIFIHRLSNGNFVGVQEIILGSDILIFPNPTNGQINLKTTNGIKSIKVFNVTSQVIFESANISTDNFNLDISSHSAGLYFIEIKQDKNIYRTKLIKN